MSGYRRCATIPAILVPPPKCKRRLSAPAALPPITASPARSELPRRRIITRWLLAALLERLAGIWSSVLSLSGLLRASLLMERGGFCSLMLSFSSNIRYLHKCCSCSIACKYRRVKSIREYHIDTMCYPSVGFLLAKYQYLSLLQVCAILCHEIKCILSFNCRGSDISSASIEKARYIATKEME